MLNELNLVYTPPWNNIATPSFRGRNYITTENKSQAKSSKEGSVHKLLSPHSEVKVKISGPSRLLIFVLIFLAECTSTGWCLLSIPLQMPALEVFT